MYESKYLENESKKYPRSNELRDSRDDEHTTSRNIALDNPEWDIDGECYQVSKSEEEPDENKIIEEKTKEKYHRKVENHPYKTLEAIGDIKIAKTVSVQSCLCRYHYRIRSMIDRLYSVGIC
jgi:hypothetical protein